MNQIDLLNEISTQGNSHLSGNPIWETLKSLIVLQLKGGISS